MRPRQQIRRGHGDETGSGNDDQRGYNRRLRRRAFDASDNRHDREQRPQRDDLDRGVGLPDRIAGGVAVAEAGERRQRQHPEQPGDNA
jgi:hypothetical protein